MSGFIVCNAGAFLQCVLGRKREEYKTVRFFFSKSVFQGANRRREHFHLTAGARSWAVL